MATKSKKVLSLRANIEDVKKALELAEQLQEIGSRLGFNVFQPGAMKELKMADILKHDWILSKKNADACSRANHDEEYEYLSGKVGGAGQIDRVFKNDPIDIDQQNKHTKSMERIQRNKAFYLAYTNPDTSKPLDIWKIYEVSTGDIEKETKTQLQNSSNKISHVSFPESFAQKHGKKIWEKK